ncbi:MAG TPA: hypothetical protein VJY34_00015, partial [Roseiarcus sp.]|nr:hypothetical protein [Roseiarcus sp.]
LAIARADPAAKGQSWNERSTRDEPGLRALAEGETQVGLSRAKSAAVAIVLLKPSELYARIEKASPSL